MYFKYLDFNYFLTCIIILGVADPEIRCDDLPRHVGLWLDVFAFIAIMLQIILFSTTYWNHIRQSALSKYVSRDPYWWGISMFELAICDQICEKGSYTHIRFSKFDSACSLAIVSKFCGMNFTLHNTVTEYELNCFTTHWVMLFKSCKIGCVYKTPFRKSGHIIPWNFQSRKLLCLVILENIFAKWFHGLVMKFFIWKSCSKT